MGFLFSFIYDTERDKSPHSNLRCIQKILRLSLVVAILEEFINSKINQWRVK
jgi:hypothetical protein